LLFGLVPNSPAHHRFQPTQQANVLEQNNYDQRGTYRECHVRSDAVEKVPVNDKHRCNYHR